MFFLSDQYGVYSDDINKSTSFKKNTVLIPLSEESEEKCRQKLQLQNKVSFVFYNILLFVTMLFLVLIMIHGYKPIRTAYYSNKAVDFMFISAIHKNDSMALNQVWISFLFSNKHFFYFPLSCVDWFDIWTWFRLSELAVKFKICRSSRVKNSKTINDQRCLLFQWHNDDQWWNMTWQGLSLSGKKVHFFWFYLIWRIWITQSEVVCMDVLTVF